MPDRASDRNRSAEDPDFPPLPPWIARRLLQEGEEVTWVRGPAGNGLERFITHPLLVVVGVILAVGCVVGNAVAAGGLSHLPIPAVLVALGLFFGSIMVVGLANAWFTRLVVTNHRLLITQGYELCRTWKVDRLPRSLLRYASSDEDGEVTRRVDLDALKSILGDSARPSSSSTSILSLGKQIDQITRREKEDR